MENSDSIEKECIICCDDLDEHTLLQYRKNNSDTWFNTNVCSNCVLYMKDTQFSNYVEKVKMTDCKKELKQLLDKGPPIWTSDPNIFDQVNYEPDQIELEGQGQQEQQEHVVELKYNGVIMSAKLTGALEGNERLELWNNLKKMRPF